MLNEDKIMEFNVDSSFEEDVRSILRRMVELQHENYHEHELCEKIHKGHLSDITLDMIREFPEDCGANWDNIVTFPLRFVRGIGENYLLHNSHLLVREEIFNKVHFSNTTLDPHIRYVLITNSDVIRKKIYEKSLECKCDITCWRAENILEGNIRLSLKNISTLDYDNMYPSLFADFIENGTDSRDYDDAKISLAKTLEVRLRRGGLITGDNCMENILYIISRGIDVTNYSFFEYCLQMNDIKFLQILLDHGLDIPKLSRFPETMKYALTHTTPEMFSICLENGLYLPSDSDILQSKNHQDDKIKNYFQKIQMIHDRNGSLASLLYILAINNKKMM